MVSTHSLSTRFNNIAVFSVAILVLLSGANYLTGQITKKDVPASFKLNNMQYLYFKSARHK